MAHARFVLDRYGYTCTPTPVIPHPHKRTHTHALTHARTRTEKYVILIAFPRYQLFRERASVLRYVYIDCLVFICFLFFSLEPYFPASFSSTRENSCHISTDAEINAFPFVTETFVLR